MRFQRRAVVGFALARAQRLLGAIAQPRQRRLEIVGDVVGDLLEAPHQRLDPLQHDVEVDREPVELVVGAGDRQPAGEIAGHDGARRLGHGVDAAQHAARDEEAAGQPEHDDQRDRPLPGGENDVVEPLALLEIAADQQAEAARQLEHAHQRVMLGAFRIVEAAIDRLGPAGVLEHALAEQADIAGEPVAAERGDEIEARSRPARARVDDEDQPPDAALVVLLGQAGDFGVDRASNLLGDQTPRVPGEIAEQERRKQREHGEIDQRQLERGGVGELAERAQARPGPRLQPGDGHRAQPRSGWRRRCGASPALES